MNSTVIIKQEYFELIKKLNQANKHENQVTEIYFYIDSSELNHLKLFAAISESQKILLCHKNYRSAWIEAGFSEYPYLENYIIQLLKTYDLQDNLTNHIKSHVFKLTS